MEQNHAADRVGDASIIDLYWQRSEQAVYLTHQRYGGLCTRVAQNILGNPADAEECVNDTYLKVWQSIPPARPASLQAFLLRITRNLALDRLRARRRQKRDEGFTVMLSELGDCIPAPEETDATELLGHIKTFLLPRLRGTTDGRGLRTDTQRRVPAAPQDERKAESLPD